MDLVHPVPTDHQRECFFVNKLILFILITCQLYFVAFFFTYCSIILKLLLVLISFFFFLTIIIIVIALFYLSILSTLTCSAPKNTKEHLSYLLNTKQCQLCNILLFGNLHFILSSTWWLIPVFQQTHLVTVYLGIFYSWPTNMSGKMLMLKTLVLFSSHFQSKAYKLNAETC